MPSIDASERDAMIRTMLAEAGDQTPEGQAAVAHVILNRAGKPEFGKRINDVIFQRGAFESWSDPRNPLHYRADSPVYQKTGKILDDVISGKTPDPTGGASHFLDPELQRNRGAKMPDWASGQGYQIGDHTFYAPGNPNYQGGGEDFLGKAANPPATSEPRSGLRVRTHQEGGWPAPVSVTTSPIAKPSEAPGEEDFLAAAAKAIPATAAPTGASTRAAGQPSPSPLPQSPETLPQAVARMTAENQGGDLGSVAARTGLGAIRGIGDVADTLAQGIGAAGTGGANVLQRAGIISPETAGAVGTWREGINRRIAEDRSAFEQAAADSTASGIGRIGGQIAGSAPLLGFAGRAAMLPVNAATRASAPLAQAVAQPGLLGRLSQVTGAGALAGGGTAALTSSTSDTPLLEQAALGGTIGAGLGPVGYGLSQAGRGIARGLFGRGLDAETRTLAESARAQGIPVTAGQITTNPMARFADSVFQRMPFMGYGARTVAQQTGLNRAVAAEMGVTADKITPDVVRHAARTAYAEYDAAKAALKGNLNVDPQFFHDLHNIAQNAGYTLEPAQQKLVDKHLTNVFGKIDLNTHSLDADIYQSLTRKNGPLDTAINSRDSKISTYATGIKNALEGLVERNSPQLKRLKDEADYKYFVTKSVEPLALDAPTGNISPAKLLKAVDHSERNIGTLGHIGQRFLKEPPSSGTAERATILMGLGKAAAAATGIGGTYAFDPEHFQQNLAKAAAAYGLARGGSAALRSNWLTSALLQRGTAGQGQEFANALSRAAPLAAITGRNALAPQQ